jgi:hypothetical protein
MKARARTALRPFAFALAWTFAAGCSGGQPVSPASSMASRQPTVRTPTPIAGAPSAAPSGVPVLRDGQIRPGTYLFMHQQLCGGEPGSDCAPGATPPPPLGIELTIPAGWQASNEFFLISPVEGREPGTPQNSALVMGWTNFWVGLNSEPCSQTSHQRTDIPVGPSVEDFVAAVVAHPKLDVTEPTAVSLGGYSGRFFTLTTPADTSGCEEWRPWDPGFYAQGPSNIWDIWVMGVNGFRILIVAQYFPSTPADVTAELHEIAESIRFVP